jgi:hypothetical protein
MIGLKTAGLKFENKASTGSKGGGGVTSIDGESRWHAAGLIRPVEESGHHAVGLTRPVQPRRAGGRGRRHSREVEPGWATMASGEGRAHGGVWGWLGSTWLAARGGNVWHSRWMAAPGGGRRWRMVEGGVSAWWDLTVWVSQRETLGVGLGYLSTFDKHNNKNHWTYHNSQRPKFSHQK